MFNVIWLSFEHYYCEGFISTTDAQRGEAAMQRRFVGSIRYSETIDRPLGTSRARHLCLRCGHVDRRGRHVATLCTAHIHNLYECTTWGTRSHAAWRRAHLLASLAAWVLQSTLPSSIATFSLHLLKNIHRLFTRSFKKYTPAFSPVHLKIYTGLFTRSFKKYVYTLPFLLISLYIPSILHT